MPADIVPFPPRIVKEGKPSLWPGASALIVDSDVTARRFLRDLLTDIGIAVFEVETAAQAREVVSQNAVRLALIEVNLTPTPGDTLAKEIARVGVTPILMAATDYGIARARKTRFRLLRKPFSLKDALREIVHTQHRGPAAKLSERTAI